MVKKQAGLFLLASCDFLCTLQVAPPGLPGPPGTRSSGQAATHPHRFCACANGAGYVIVDGTCQKCDAGDDCAKCDPANLSVSATWEVPLPRSHGTGLQGFEAQQLLQSISSCAVLASAGLVHCTPSRPIMLCCGPAGVPVLREPQQHDRASGRQVRAAMQGHQLPDVRQP